MDAPPEWNPMDPKVMSGQERLHWRIKSVMSIGSILLQLVINGILRGGVYALLGIGLTIIYGVARIVNFAHGELVMCGMYATYFLFTFLHVNPFLGLLIVIPVFFGLGILLYRLIFARLIEAGHFAQVFTTNGLAIVIQNTALVALGATPLMATVPSLSRVMLLGPVRASLIDVCGFVLAAVLMAVLFLFLKYTWTGKGIRAVVDQRRGAKLVGLNVNSMYQIALGIGLACIAAAGAILVTNYYVYPGCGAMWMFVAFVAVIMGGRNSIPGTVLAALIVGLVESFSGYFIAVQLKEGMYFLAFLIFMLIRPTGIFGHAQ